MKIDNFIWGGCSYSAGSGFTDNPMWDNPEADFSFAHKDLKQYFEEPHNVGNIKSQIEKIVFPYQLGKKLGASNIQNFAAGGMGYPIQIRKIFSYLIENEDKLDFTKTSVGIQLTSFQRDEVIKVILKEHLPHHDKNQIDRIKFAWLDGQSHENHAKDYILKYWDGGYSVMNALQNLIIFKGWCENMGVKLHLFEFCCSVENQINPYKERIELWRTQINHQELSHNTPDFPQIETLVKKLEIEPIGDKITGGLPGYIKAFVNDGFHDDTHFSITGHNQVTEFLYDAYKNKLGYE
jgi:hypothetical protein